MRKALRNRIVSGIRVEGSGQETQRFLEPLFDVLLTTDAFVLRDKSFLKKIQWEYLIVDEAHRYVSVLQGAFEFFPSFMVLSSRLICLLKLKMHAPLIGIVWSGASRHREWHRLLVGFSAGAVCVCCVCCVLRKCFFTGPVFSKCVTSCINNLHSAALSSLDSRTRTASLCRL